MQIIMHTYVSSLIWILNRDPFPLLKDKYWTEKEGAQFLAVASQGGLVMADIVSASSWISKWSMDNEFVM